MEMGHGTWGIMAPQPIGCILLLLLLLCTASSIHMVEIHTHARTEARTEFLQPDGQFA